MPSNDKSKTVAFALTLGLGVIAVACATFVEVAAAFPLPAWFYGLLCLPIIAPVVVCPSRLAATCAALFVGCLLACSLVPWTSRKPFLEHLDKVRPGMTEAQVRGFMAGYKEGTGWPAAPWQPVGSAGTLQTIGSSNTFRTVTDSNGKMSLIDSLVFRHSDDGCFNSDWGVVQLKDGRVLRVEFLPD